MFYDYITCYVVGQSPYLYQVTTTCVELVSSVCSEQHCRSMVAFVAGDCLLSFIIIILYLQLLAPSHMGTESGGEAASDTDTSSDTVDY